jgi:hypothetical protein
MSDTLLIFGLLGVLLVIAAVFSVILTDHSDDEPGDSEHFDHGHSDPYSP